MALALCGNARELGARRGREGIRQLVVKAIGVSSAHSHVPISFTSGCRRQSRLRCTSLRRFGGEGNRRRVSISVSPVQSRVSACNSTTSAEPIPITSHAQRFAAARVQA